MDNYAPGTANDPRAPWNEEDIPMKVCPDCEGEHRNLSVCCGARIDSDILICSECKDHSDIAVCETCNGEGEIEMTEEDIRNERENKLEKRNGQAD